MIKAKKTLCWKTYSALSWRGLRFGKSCCEEKGRWGKWSWRKDGDACREALPPYQGSRKRKRERDALRRSSHSTGVNRQRQKLDQRGKKRDFHSRDIKLWLCYLIKIWIIAPPYSSSVCVSACVDFHHRLDVVARQLATFNDPNPNLYKGVRKEEVKLKSLLGTFFSPCPSFCYVSIFADLLACQLICWPAFSSELRCFDHRSRECGQYLEVLRLIGQGFMPLSPQTCLLVVWFPRMIWWSGNSCTTSLTSGDLNSLILISVITSPCSGRWH